MTLKKLFVRLFKKLSRLLSSRAGKVYRFVKRATILAWFLPREIPERPAPIIEKQVFPSNELDKQQQRYINTLSSQFSRYIFLVSRQKINLTRDAHITATSRRFYLDVSTVLPCKQPPRAPDASSPATTVHLLCSNVLPSYRLQIDRNFERENRRTSKETDNAVGRGGLIGDLRAVCSDVDDLSRFSGQT